MTDTARLVQLVTLCDAAYRRQQQSIQKILNEEARLRHQLAQLDQHAQRPAQDIDIAHRALGADILWQGWLGRKKRDLNQQLARLMVIKEKQLSQVRAAYGKFLVASELRDDALQVQRSKKRDSELDHAIESALFRHSVNQ